MRQWLYLPGLLVGFTRQLDGRMTSEGHFAGFIKKLDTLLEVATYEH
jgi:hypothetical protein